MAAPTPGELKVRLDSHRDRLDKNDAEHKDLWDGQKQMATRLPHWATLLISVLTLVVGALLRSVF